MPSVRCLNCRENFEDSHEYLVHECEPDPSTADLWDGDAFDPEEFSPDEVAAEIAAIEDRLGELLDEAAQLQALRRALDDVDEDPLFGLDDDDEYPIGLVRGALLGAGLVIGLGLLVADLVVGAIRKALS